MEVMPMFCMKCGYKNVDGARFCGKCGAPLTYDGEFNSDDATRGRGDETHMAGRMAGSRRYGDDTSRTLRTGSGQRYGDDLSQTRRPDRSQTYGYDIPESQRTGTKGRYGEDNDDDYPYVSPSAGKTGNSTSSKKKKKSKERRETPTVRIVLACLITLAFVAVAGFMLYQVFNRKDPSPDIVPFEETGSGGQDSTQGNVAEQPAESAGDGAQTQPQEPYMEIYDDNGGVIVVDGQSVPEDPADAGSLNSAGDMAPEEAPGALNAQAASGNTAVNMEPVEGEGVRSQTQTTQQAPTTAAVLPTSSSPDLSGYQPANVVNATASSTIAQTKTDNHPMLLFDGRDDTTWQEGAQGYGISEWVSWNMDRKYNVKYIGFKMGNWVSDYYYYGNARPKTIVLTVGDFTGQVTFTNERAVQWVELSNEVPADSMRIQINDVFPGTTWQDTCITEILVYGK